MATKQIKKNQVVWAKLKGYPWWPSCISQVGTSDVVVNFLGENTHATIKLDQVHDFKENYSQYIKNVNDRNKKLKQAVAIGLRISEGKTSYEDERKNMERKYQMEEEDEENTNQTSSESSGKPKKVKKGTLTKKPTKSTSASATPTAAQTTPTTTVAATAAGKKTPVKKAIRSTSKSTKGGAVESESKNSNLINDKIVPENAGEPSLAASEKDVVTTTNTRQVGNKKQQKLNEKQTRKNQQNANKSTPTPVVLNNDSTVEELVDTPSHQISNPIHDKEYNSAEQLASFNQKADISGDKSPTHQSHQNDTEQNEIEEEEQEQEEMNLEKATKKSAASANGSPRNGFAEDKKDSFNNNNQNNTSDSNLQSSNGQGTNPQKNTQNTNNNKRNKRSSTKNGSTTIPNLNTSLAANNDPSNPNQIVDSPKKKIKGNNQQTYYTSPQDASELQINLESILDTFSSKKNQNIFKLNEIKELDRMCDIYFSLNIPSLDFIKTSLGKSFLSSLLYISSQKHSEEYNPEIKQKLEVVVENIRDKVLLDTLGSDMKELNLKKKSLVNGNGAQQSEVEQEEKSIHSNTQLNKPITSHTKLNGDVATNQEKEAEDPKKLRDQQLRKKICKKINELLKENYGLEKAQAQDLCVQIERKIKSVQVELNHDYKSNVKGLIRLLKSKEISIDKLQKCNVDELIQAIQHGNIQADLRGQGVPQFEKNSSMVDNSD